MRLEIATRCNDNAGPIRFVERRSTNAFISNRQEESPVQLDGSLFLFLVLFTSLASIVFNERVAYKRYTKIQISEDI